MRLGHLARAAALAVALLLGPTAAVADEAGWSHDLSSEMMSPFCPGRTLNDCPSPQAGELRKWIERQEGEGRGREDVEAQLLRLYGDVVRSAPAAEGWGLTAYVGPAVLVLLAGGFLVVFLRRQASRPAAAAAASPPNVPDAELERIVEEELRRTG